MGNTGSVNEHNDKNKNGFDNVSIMVVSGFSPRPMHYQFYAHSQRWAMLSMLGCIRGCWYEAYQWPQPPQSNSPTPPLDFLIVLLPIMGDRSDLGVGLVDTLDITMGALITNMAPVPPLWTCPFL